MRTFTGFSMVTLHYDASVRSESGSPSLVSFQAGKTAITLKQVTSDTDSRRGCKTR
jgi:hypothetical protein